MLECGVKAYTGTEPFIFVSYAHADAHMVYPIIERLVLDGHRVWYDDGIHAGEDWTETVADRLDESSICIAMLSEHSVASVNCRNEINYSINGGKTLIGLKLTNFEMPKGLRLQMGSTLYLERYRYGETEFYERLMLSHGMAGCRAEQPRITDGQLMAWRDKWSNVTPINPARGEIEPLKLQRRSAEQGTAAQAAKPEPEKKRKKSFLPLAAGIIILAALAFFLLPKLFPGNSAQEQSSEAISSSISDQEDAASTEIPSFKKSEDVAAAIRSYGQVLAVSNFSTVAVCEDGTVAVALSHDNSWATQCGSDAVADWSDIGAVAAGDYWTFGVRNDGVVLVCGEDSGNIVDEKDMIDEVRSWTQIVKLECSGGMITEMSGKTLLSSDFYHTVGLRFDGTAVAAGDSYYGECNVSDWSDLVDVAAGFTHTLGLRSDGTVISTGSNKNGQCDVGDWAGVIQIAAGKYSSVGLKADGTILIAGNGGQSELGVNPAMVGSWENIKWIYLGHDGGVDIDFLLAIDADGKVHYSGGTHQLAEMVCVDPVRCVGSSWGYFAYLKNNGEIYGYTTGDLTDEMADRLGTPLWENILLPPERA